MNDEEFIFYNFKTKKKKQKQHHSQGGEGGAREGFKAVKKLVFKTKKTSSHIFLPHTQTDDQPFLCSHKTKKNKKQIKIKK